MSRRPFAQALALNYTDVTTVDGGNIARRCGRADERHADCGAARSARGEPDRPAARTASRRRRTAVQHARQRTTSCATAHRHSGPDCMAATGPSAPADGSPCASLPKSLAVDEGQRIAAAPCAPDHPAPRTGVGRTATTGRGVRRRCYPSTWLSLTILTGATPPRSHPAGRRHWASGYDGIEAGVKAE